MPTLDGNEGPISTTSHYGLFRPYEYLSGMDADDALAVAEHTDVRKLGRVKMLSSIQVRFVPFADIVDDSFS